MTKNTRVCSNHFVHGGPTKDHPSPVLYLKGYPVEIYEMHNIVPPSNARTGMKRREAMERKYTRAEKKRKIQACTPSPTPEHDYELVNYKEEAARTNHPMQCDETKYRKVIAQLRKEKEELQEKLNDAKERLVDVAEKSGKFSTTSIKDSDKLFKMYTGFQNYEMFKFIFEKIKEKASRLSYHTGMKCLKANKRKPGPEGMLDDEQKFLLTTVKLKLGLTHEDLAFRFGISTSSCSRIVRTWICFLGKELKSLIYFPTAEENLCYYPSCFQQDDKVRIIIDCTELGLEKPSLAKAQAQTYSNYKSRNTCKVLIGCTPAGYPCFVSKAYGGKASDRFIVENSGFLNMICDGETVMADKGFDIQDLLLAKQSNLIIPPFKRKSEKRFTQGKARQTSQIAKARIHVERCIGRIKNFRILKSTIPVTQKDLISDIFTVCAAVTCLQPPLVPL